MLSPLNIPSRCVDGRLQEIKDLVYGKYLARPVENQLAKLVSFWQASQPLHLRHLAIVRDIAMINRNTHYVHYTFENFQKLVDRGEATWDAVETENKPKKQTQTSKGPSNAEAELDCYGFPRLPSSLFHGARNDSTLAQCIQAVTVAPVRLKKHDPVVHKSSNGDDG